MTLIFVLSLINHTKCMVRIDDLPSQNQSFLGECNDQDRIHFMLAVRYQNECTMPYDPKLFNFSFQQPELLCWRDDCKRMMWQERARCRTVETMPEEQVGEEEV